MSNATDSSDEMAMLLPFYVNGTLILHDVARIDAALKISPALRAELAAVQALQAMAQQADALIHPADLASTVRLEKLLSRIEAETPAIAAPVKILAKQSFFAQLLSFRWQPAFAATAACILVLQSGLIGYFAMRRSDSGSYGTLSGNVNAAQKASIMVQFKAGARWFDIHALLLREDLAVVSGPTDSSLGLAPNKPKTDAELAALLNQLRNSPIITFASEAE
jgi:hypothetical protein